MVKEEVAVLIVLVRRHRRAVGAAVRWAVGDEAPGADDEEAGPAAVRCVRFFGFIGDRSGSSRAKPTAAEFSITEVSSLGQLPVQDRAEPPQLPCWRDEPAVSLGSVRDLAPN